MPNASSRVARPSARPLALLALLPLLACSGPSPAPSVLLVTLDTTRRDRLGVYGDPDARTPFLDAEARRGALCRNAVADASTTLPSHASMLTGSLGPRHGVRQNGRTALAAEAVTVTELLRERGWSTAAVVSSSVLRADHGLDQGFTRYDDRMPPDYPVYDARWRYRAIRLGGNQRRADQTTDAARRALGDLTAPAFLWVHYIDAHQPNDSPPPWDRVPGLDPYSAEVAVVDRAMGQVLRLTRAALGPLAVVIVADHGEELGEHGYHGHSLLLYDAIVRIPLVVSAPDLQPVIVPTIVRNCDVAPVLAALAGIPAEFPDGRSFLSERAPSPRFAFSETLAPRDAYGGAATQSLRTDTHKLILAPEGELYDLLADGSERTNLWHTRPSLRDDLLDELDAFRRSIPEAEATVRPVALDDRRVEELRALGYAASPGPDDGPRLVAEGIDPKELIDVVEAARLVDDGLFDGVEARLERFWSRHPTPPDTTWHPLFARARFCRAALRFTAGNHAEAASDLRRALELDPGLRDAQTLLSAIEGP